MTFDGSVSGVGDRAAAFSKRSEPGFKYAEHAIYARSGNNLAAEVWLAIGGTTFTSEHVLAQKSQVIMTATLAMVPKS